MTNIIFFVIGVGIMWFLHLVFKELQLIRYLLEIPSKARKNYDEQLDEVNKDIHSAFTLMLVTPVGERENARKSELLELVKKQKEILEHRRKHFYIRPEYLK